MASDETIKIAEEYALKSGWSCIDEQLAGAEAFAIKQTYIDAYTQGRADALKELEQLKREAFLAGKRAVMEFTAGIAPTVQSVDDYLKQRNREQALSELVADGEKNGDYDDQAS